MFRETFHKLHQTAKTRNSGIVLQLVWLTAIALGFSMSGAAQSSSSTSPAFTAAEGAFAPLTGQVTNNVLVFDFSRSDITPVIPNATGAKPNLVFNGNVRFWANSGTTNSSTASSSSSSSTNPVIMTAEIPLLTTEVPQVVKSLDSSGLFITISAIHNHILESNPPSIFMHLEASGDATKLATAVVTALKLTAIDLSPTTPQTTLANLNTVQIESLLGATGMARDGVYEVEIPRTETISECVTIAVAADSSLSTSSSASGGYSAVSNAVGKCLATPFTRTSAGGITVPPVLGAVSEVAIQPTSSSSAIVAGELALLPTEIEPTMHFLESTGNFQFSGVHNHFVFMAPQLFFVHFTAVGNPATISTQIRQAISANRLLAGQQP